MAFKMKGFKAHDNSPLDNYQTGYYGEGKSAPLRKTYAEAYADRDKSLYGESMTQAEYTTEAKRQNKIFKETGKWDIPKTKMTGSKITKPKSTTVTTKRPGGGTKEVRTDSDNFQVTTKYRKDDTIKKQKTNWPGGDKDKTKTFKGTSKIRKSKETYRTGDTVNVDKTKYYKVYGERKLRKKITRTRKKGGTGIGQAIKDTLARKKKKKEERKANKKVNKKNNSSDIFS